MNFKAAIALALVPALLVLTGCPRPKDDPPEERNPRQQQESQDALTLAEAKIALEEVQVSGEASSLISGSIEVTTGFTIGQAVEHAAEEIGELVASQLPCAEITVESQSLTIEYGAKPGDCTYHGQTYSGTHSVRVEANEDHEVLVHHEWDGLSNGNVSATGFADVTWSLQDRTRRVVHELAWTRLSDGRTGTGSGDRLQSALNGDLAEGDSIKVTFAGTKRSFDILVHKPGGANDDQDAPAEADAS